MQNVEILLISDWIITNFLSFMLAAFDLDKKHKYHYNPFDTHCHFKNFPPIQ